MKDRQVSSASWRRTKLKSWKLLIFFLTHFCTSYLHMHLCYWFAQIVTNWLRLVWDDHTNMKMTFFVLWNYCVHQMFNIWWSKQLRWHPFLSLSFSLLLSHSRSLNHKRTYFSIFNSIKYFLFLFSSFSFNIVHIFINLYLTSIPTKRTPNYRNRSQQKN